MLCAVSLGGNVGDVSATFVEALRRLSASPDFRSVRMSRYYRSTPMGASAGDPFLNAACVFETDILPEQVLDQLQKIENLCGRERSVHWGPRTLDLDLVLYGDQIWDSPRLTVPHSAMWHRRFVLDPLAELIPTAVHPVLQLSMRDLQLRLQARPLLVGWSVPTRLLPLPQKEVAAEPTIRWFAPDIDSLKLATIIFTGPQTDLIFPNIIQLPSDPNAARQMVTDVLTAALDEPVAIP